MADVDRARGGDPEPGQRFRAERVVTPAGLRHDMVIAVSGTHLVSCEPFVESTEELEEITGWVVPGFVDTHVHGGGGFDYATVDPRVAIGGRAFHAAHGTTTSFASLVTAPVPVLCDQVSMLADLVVDGYFDGIHLEGPFLSTAQHGAHDPALLRTPDPVSVDRLITAGRGTVSLVTLAPELVGAAAALRQLTEAGVQVAIGHTDADDGTVAAALDAGAGVATHLFNAMPAIHHRRPGPIPQLLTDPRVDVELIADGFHLHPSILRLAAAAAGGERVLLITDAMAAAGLADGDFTLGGLEVAVRDGKAHVVEPDGRRGPIAGSTLTMAGAFAVMAGVVGDIAAVAAMASTNAARRYGLTDRGRIEAGGRADLCVVDHRGALLRVMQSGQWLPQRSTG